MQTKGFYKLEDGGLLHAPNFVAAPSFELEAEKKDEYTYPVEGWFWFDSEEEAKAYFGIEPDVIDTEAEVIE